jgi:hypothetical protein
MVQGFFYGLYQSIPFSYQKIPNYRVLSMFSLSSIPFSVKFLIGTFQIIKRHLNKNLLFENMEKEKPGL